jgi:hypothetical protein
MAFAARDLMIDVFPAEEPPGLIACAEASPPPRPQCKAPSCAQYSKAEGVEEECAELGALEVLREQLRQALRS